MLFDNTGTLTMGRPEPLGLKSVQARELAVRVALALGSSHPLAQAFVVGAKIFFVRKILGLAR